ncbi:MAG: VOC family protein [Burkholderiales bacterium]|nr:VOC family protein [Burkholderiales bacterium]
MTPSKVKPIPEGMHTLTPHLVCAGAAAAIEFYEKAFGAIETFRLAGPDGKLVHASLRIGDSTLMLVDEFPAMGARGPGQLGGSPVTVHLAVDDAAGVMRQAEAAGASVRMPLTDMFWGALYGVLEDPFGHIWSVATQIRDLTPQEIEAAMREYASAHRPERA